MAETEIVGTPLFAEISEESAATVAADGVTDVPAGQVLAQAGDHGRGMFVVLDGSVVVERGDLHIEMGRGEFFGELALLVPDSPRIARVRALTDSRCSRCAARPSTSCSRPSRPSPARCCAGWPPGWSRPAPGTDPARRSRTRRPAVARPLGSLPEPRLVRGPRRRLVRRRSGRDAPAERPPARFRSFRGDRQAGRPAGCSATERRAGRVDVRVEAGADEQPGRRASWSSTCRPGRRGRSPRPAGGRSAPGRAPSRRPGRRWTGSGGSRRRTPGRGSHHPASSAPRSGTTGSGPGTARRPGPRRPRPRSTLGPPHTGVISMTVRTPSRQTASAAW